MLLVSSTYSYFILLTYFTFLVHLFIIKSIFPDFFESTVVYNIDSPTVSLDYVYFPSVTICNMNNLRRSFIHSLMSDENIRQMTNTNSLKILIDDVFLSGGKHELSKEEEKLIDSKLILALILMKS